MKDHKIRSLTDNERTYLHGSFPISFSIWLALVTLTLMTHGVAANFAPHFAPSPPLSAWNQGWKHFWNIDRPDGPTSDDAIKVIEGLGLEPEVFEVERPPLSRHAEDPASLVISARRRLCLPASRDAEIEEWLRDHPPAFMSDVVVLRWPGGLS